MVFNRFKESISIIILFSVLIKVLIAPVLALGDALVLGVVVGHYAFERFTEAKIERQESVNIASLKAQVNELEDKVSALNVSQGLRRK